MKRARYAAVGLLMVLTAGCAATTARGSGGRELTLLQPASQTVRRGETNRVAITVVRENLPGNVAVRFERLPRGVRVVEVDRAITPGEVTVDYTLFAAKDADLVANHQALVTAETPDGLSASEELILTIVD